MLVATTPNHTDKELLSSNTAKHRREQSIDVESQLIADGINYKRMDH